jgi:hypothetical protein
MRAYARVVILAIVALFTAGLRAPSLPRLESGSTEDQVSAYRGDALPALSPSRHGRAPETARKAPLLAVLPSLPLLLPTPCSCIEPSPPAQLLRSRPELCRTSRGPPSRT